MHFGLLRRGAAAALGTLALATLALSGPAGAYSAAAVKDAQQLLDTVRGQFTAGLMSRGEFALAEYRVLDTRYRAGQMSHAELLPAGRAGDRGRVLARRRSDGSPGTCARPVEAFVRAARDA